MIPATKYVLCWEKTQRNLNLLVECACAIISRYGTVLTSMLNHHMLGSITLKE